MRCTGCGKDAINANIIKTMHNQPNGSYTDLLSTQFGSVRHRNTYFLRSGSEGLGLTGPPIFNRDRMLCNFIAFAQLSCKQLIFVIKM